ncbi:uncharacterized protein LOC136035420 [Artemia franciscana]|uniref:uncharacterized protein LOC136035420 n=1 Tax=Artemia franciscana TaxID=6661 RepID=UPI0032DA283A
MHCCRCQFSMVPSPKGCVSILEQELLATKDYQLEVSDVEWSDSLSTITSIESLLLIEKFYKLVVRIDASLCTDDACLPGQSCNLIASEVGFQCTCPFPQTLIEGIRKLDLLLKREFFWTLITVKTQMPVEQNRPPASISLDILSVFVLYVFFHTLMDALI